MAESADSGTCTDDDSLTMSVVNNKEQAVQFLKNDIIIFNKKPHPPKQDMEIPSSVNNQDSKQSYHESVKRVAYTEAQTAMKQNPTDMNKLVALAQKVNNHWSDSNSVEKLLMAATDFAASDIQAQSRDNTKIIREELQNCINLLPKAMLENLPLEPNLHPLSFLYHLQQQEPIKTPSWKLRMHRYYPSFDHQMIFALQDSLYLAKLAYADSIPKVQQGLENYQGSSKYPWNLLYCTLVGDVKQPAHFLCVQQFSVPPQEGKHNNNWFQWWNSAETYLDLLLVIRGGTKGLSDVISNFNMNLVDYKTRGAKGHEGFVNAGKYIVEKHINTIKLLWSESKRNKVRISIIGHSIGASVSTFVGLELNKYASFIETKVINFGSLPCVNKVLADKTKSFVTTVVADDDIAPRLSNETVINMFLNVMATKWEDNAMEDLSHLFDALRTKLPFTLDQYKKKTLMAQIRKNLITSNNNNNNNIHPDVSEIPTKRQETILYPPGRCIHLFRNGCGVSATFVPNDFFNKISLSRTMLEDHSIDNGYDKLLTEMLQTNYYENNNN